ncbi:hypothetical protein EYB25_001752 [Talaromyces marneffei]|nr:hypothetical protein EYB25_001752 [Talaromyces marneffei]
MNWTGGRLRRQSRNRPDSISKIQKQHFARARIKQQESRQKTRIASIEKPSFVFNSRKSGESSHFIADNQSTQSFARMDQTFQSSKLRQNQANSSDTSGYFGAGNRDLETQSSTAYVDLLKKYLLDQKDWVGLSPTRPLQMKFIPIEEKERIGKRRKLSREDEVRKTAMTKHATSLAHISSHADRPQSGGGRHDGTDWNLKIHISSPQRMRRTQEYSESPIRSMSSDTMLSAFGEANEGDSFPEQKERDSRVQSNRENELVTNSFVHGPDSQSCSAQDCDNTADLAETEARIRSSPIAVLHRFTLDDQVLAERLANSQMEAESPRSHRSDNYSIMLSHELQRHHGTFENEILLGSSPGINSDNRHTNLSGSHESYPTDSDTLPKTQKIQRQLPPSQPQMAKSLFSENQFQTLRVTSSFSTVPESVFNPKEPTTLFGQKLYSLSPKPFDKDSKSTTSERPFLSKKHGYHIAPPNVQPVETPRVHQTSVLKSVTGTRPTSESRFPNLWTPRRAATRLSPYNEICQRVEIPTSPVVSHRWPSPFISTLSQGSYRARQPLTTAKSSLSKIFKDTRAIDGYDDGIHAPVFNTPFRRF